MYKRKVGLLHPVWRFSHAKLWVETLRKYMCLVLLFGGRGLDTQGIQDGRLGKIVGRVDIFGPHCRVDLISIFQLFHDLFWPLLIRPIFKESGK